MTYSFYPVWCSLFGIKYKNYPVGDDFRINPEYYKEKNGGVVIPNPNAPTSLGEGLDFVEKILPDNNMIFWCPCKSCFNTKKHHMDVIFNHCGCDEIIQNYKKWVRHGEA